MDDDSGPVLLCCLYRTGSGSSPRHGRWADLGNLHVAEPYRRRGVATWLLAQAGDWLRLAQVERLLDYAWLAGQDETGQSYEHYRSFLTACGFLELTRTKRGWTRLSGRDGGGDGWRDDSERRARVQSR